MPITHYLKLRRRWLEPGAQMAADQHDSRSDFSVLPQRRPEPLCQHDFGPSPSVLS